jgi:pimeloyl-ACP methyl ester carboxylesterase
MLAVPFDELIGTAAEHVPRLLAKLLLGSTWDNIRALAHYRGKMEIYGAAQDAVIPVGHARVLATSVPQARFHLLPGGHNEWWGQQGVEFRNP